MTYGQRVDASRSQVRCYQDFHVRELALCPWRHLPERHVVGLVIRKATWVILFRASQRLCGGERGEHLRLSLLWSIPAQGDSVNAFRDQIVCNFLCLLALIDKDQDS